MIASEPLATSPVDKFTTLDKENYMEKDDVELNRLNKKPMYVRAKASVYSWIYFLLEVLPVDIIYLLLLLRFCWRHKILTMVLCVAGAALYGHFEVKKIQTENRVIQNDSILHIKWKEVTTSEAGQNSGLGVLEVLKFIPGSGIKSSTGQLNAKQVAETIYKAANDPRIIGITCDFSTSTDDGLNLGPVSFKTGLNMAVLQEVRHALLVFKSNKPRNATMLAYANTVCQNRYYVAAVFKEIYMQPFGELSFTGKRFQSLFYKKLLDDWNITATVHKGGRMKSLYDPYIREGMEDESREQNAQLLNNLDEQFWHDIISSRDAFRTTQNLPRVCNQKNTSSEGTQTCNTQNWKHNLAIHLKKASKLGVIFGDEALALGMIDGLRYSRSIEAEAKSLAQRLDLSNYARRLQRIADAEHSPPTPPTPLTPRTSGSSPVQQFNGVRNVGRNFIVTQTTSSRARQVTVTRTISSPIQPNSRVSLKPLKPLKVTRKAQKPSVAKLTRALIPTIRIAELQISGGIVSNDNLDTLVQNLDCLANDASIQSIILRVDSSGGSYLASDTLSEAVQYAKSKKPVVASIGGMAASGAYYVVANASKVIANRASLIGSIGVTSMALDFSSFLSRFGITYESLYVGVPATIFESKTE